MNFSEDPAESSKLVLPRTIRGELVAHAREGVPEEICGVLGGKRGDAGDDARSDAAAERPDRVAVARRVPNVAEAPRVAYELDPAVTVETVGRIEAAEMDLVGFYHSHPRGPTRPSETDRADAAWPGYVYLIVTPDGAAAAYRWTGDQFDPLAIVDG